MKTTIKQLTGRIAFVAVLVMAVSGCNKHQITPSRPHKITENSKGLNCSPWRDAADPNAAVTDLNSVAVCNASTCDGTQTDFYINNTLVRDASGNIAYYDPFSPVLIADQNYIWSYAVNWAIAHKPSGFFVCQISFTTQTITITNGMFSFDVNTFKFNVLYRKCTGGGGGEES